ncbi:hypothetical protein C0J52_03262 [Blattella germanica]|nr:hypothetical protein C0J52_03262 [Blattella germanica]
MPINDLPDISQEITTASLTEPSIYFRYNPEHISKTHPKLLPMGKVKHRHNHSSYPKHSIKPIPVPTREKHQLRLSGKPYGKSSHFNIEEKMHRPGLPPDYRTKEYSESNFSEQQPLSTPYTFRTTIIVEEEHRGSHKRRLRGYFIKTPTCCSPGFVREILNNFHQNRLEQNENPVNSRDTSSVKPPEIKLNRVKKLNIVNKLLLGLLAFHRHNSRKSFGHKFKTVTNLSQHNETMISRILYATCYKNANTSNKVSFSCVNLKNFIKRQSALSSEMKLRDRSEFNFPRAVNTEIGKDMFHRKHKPRLKRSFIWGPTLCRYRNKSGKCVSIENPCPEGKRKSRSGKCRFVFKGVQNLTLSSSQEMPFRFANN